MSDLPNMLTICSNTRSLSFHSEDRSNILEILSAKMFSDPGMWAAETYIYLSAAHCHMSKAISSHKSDPISPISLIYATTVLFLHPDPNMFNDFIEFGKTKKPLFSS